MQYSFNVGNYIGRIKCTRTYTYTIQVASNKKVNKLQMQQTNRLMYYSVREYRKKNQLYLILITSTVNILYSLMMSILSCEMLDVTKCNPTSTSCR